MAGIAGSRKGSNLKVAVGTKSDACRSRATTAGFFFFFLFLLRFLAASAGSGPSATSVGTIGFFKSIRSVWGFVTYLGAS